LRPGLSQWVEDPVMFSGREQDPFAELKAPDRAFSINRAIYDRYGRLSSDAMQCRTEVGGPVNALTTGPGGAVLIFEQPWYKWFWTKVWHG
jgi:hypothetical protein